MLVLTSAALTVLETIFLLLGFLMDHDAKYAEDYRIAAGRTLASGKESVRAIHKVDTVNFLI
eukprot:m.145236 g.145236  ORF g.145236 m.145236 type:complete len:62 (+) comp38414_c0_seq20:1803-1988(+)